MMIKKIKKSFEKEVKADSNNDQNNLKSTSNNTPKKKDNEILGYRTEYHHNDIKNMVGIKEKDKNSYQIDQFQPDKAKVVSYKMVIALENNSNRNINLNFIEKEKTKLDKSNNKENKESKDNKAIAFDKEKNFGRTKIENTEDSNNQKKSRIEVNPQSNHHTKDTKANILQGKSDNNIAKNLDRGKGKKETHFNQKDKKRKYYPYFQTKNKRMW